MEANYSVIVVVARSSDQSCRFRSIDETDCRVMPEE
jgi:hypothetical protein